MVVYPEPPQGQRLTPSPFVDALQSAVNEVRDVKAQQNAASLIREENTKCNVKPASSDILLRRFDAMEEKIGRDIAELKLEIVGLKHEVEELAGLKPEIEELRRENAVLKYDINELSDRMNEATIAERLSCFCHCCCRFSH
ncbi:hypothetical protein BDR07DRAFT_1433889 [Suillus spraguei]|nr:hypothetical protein BDR07DRAFT_1433889 [Suillus spraguei]